MKNSNLHLTGGTAEKYKNDETSSIEDEDEYGAKC